MSPTTPLSFCSPFQPLLTACHTGAVQPPTPVRCSVVALRTTPSMTINRPDRTKPIPTPPTTEHAPNPFSNPEFQSNIQGEWFGYEASFSARTGEPRAIPERYIPDEFRAWNVEVFGFDHLTSSIVGDDGCLFVKLIRALPSVGCEADAVVPEIREKSYDVAKEEGILYASFSDGTFVRVPQVWSKDDYSVRWEMCIVDGGNGKQKERVWLRFGRVDEGLGAVEVVIERREGEYCAGELLPGCGGRGSFVADERAEVRDWEVRGEVWGGGLVDRVREGSGTGVVRLPGGGEVGVRDTVEGWVVHGGWVVKGDNSRWVGCEVEYDARGHVIKVVKEVGTA